MGRKQTDEISVFDMGQLLVFAEGIERHELQVGRAEARRRAVAEMHMVFDSPTLQAAVQRNDALLPSFLAQELSWVARRRDWPSRRQRFVREERDAHLAEAWRRCSELPAKRGAVPWSACGMSSGRRLRSPTPELRAAQYRHHPPLQSPGRTGRRAVGCEAPAIAAPGRIVRRRACRFPPGRGARGPAATEGIGLPGADSAQPQREHCACAVSPPQCRVCRTLVILDNLGCNLDDLP